MPVNELYCSLLCDQFVPIALFMVAYIDLKIIAICYQTQTVVHEDTGAKLKTYKMAIMATLIFSLQVSMNYSGHLLRE